MRARARSSSATQSIPDNTATTVTFNQAVFDTVGLLNTSTSELVVPSTGRVTGAWQVHAQITWDNAAAGGRDVVIQQNAVTIAHSHVLGSNDDLTLNVLILVNDPNPGTTFRVRALQTSGSPLNLLTEPENTFFEIIHLW